MVRCRVQPHLFAVMTISEIYTFSSFYLLKSFIYYVDNIESDTLDVSFIKMVKKGNTATATSAHLRGKAGV